MVMHMFQMDLYILIHKNIERSLVQESLKGYRQLRPKVLNNFLIKRKISKILLFGKRLRYRENLSGSPNGDVDAQVGIFNVQQWHLHYLVSRWIFTLGVLI